MSTFFRLALIFVSVLFILFSIFPGLVQGLTHLCGMVAPVNFLFLVMIFILLLRTFIMSIRMAELEEKVKNLTQKIAIQNHETGNEIENLKVKVGNNEND